MVFPSRRPNRPFSELSVPAESVAEHRARLAEEQEITQQRRTDALASQVSMTNTPAQRILIWEQLHGLPLPCNPNHKVLQVIAAATDLRIEQVQEVQKLRLALGSATASHPAKEAPRQ